MQVIPKALQQLIEALTALPGVGSRSAERYAYYLLQRDASTSLRLAEALQGLHSGISYCHKTFALVEAGTKLSPLYTDPDRDRQTVAVVADPFDIIAIEKTSQYKGTYHVLGGLISPIDGMSPEDLKISELLERIRDDNVLEVILATNASVEGESTALYIQKHIIDAKVKVTRLARGLPVGVDLEYADQITLGRALEGRTVL